MKHFVDAIQYQYGDFSGKATRKQFLDVPVVLRGSVLRCDDRRWPNTSHGGHPVSCCSVRTGNFHTSNKHYLQAPARYGTQRLVAIDRVRPSCGMGCALGLSRSSATK